MTDYAVLIENLRAGDPDCDDVADALEEVLAERDSLQSLIRVAEEQGQKALAAERQLRAERDALNAKLQEVVKAGDELAEFADYHSDGYSVEVTGWVNNWRGTTKGLRNE